MNMKNIPLNDNSDDAGPANVGQWSLYSIGLGFPALLFVEQVLQPLVLSVKLGLQPLVWKLCPFTFQPQNHKNPYKYTKYAGVIKLTIHNTADLLRN